MEIAMTKNYSFGICIPTGENRVACFVFRFIFLRMHRLYYEANKQIGTIIAGP